uniref:CSON009456 protein n=1 Tax=Culicoides sonorensis TaxID=179676 RepID=A0A336M0C6_CULSO
MRDLANKMAELSFEAPLARFEENDEWGDTISYQSSVINNQQSSPNANLKSAIAGTLMLNLNEDDNNVIVLEDNALQNGFNDNDFGGNDSPNCNSNAIAGTDSQRHKLKDNVDNFTEGFTGSLEDLVNTFDEKLTKCFGNYEQSVEELAPVQVRTQEEVMNDCQMWWTITGNFGNILPIDWSKSCSRQMHVPTLNLDERPSDKSIADDIQDLSSEDEAVANDLDMHALILNGLNTDNEPFKTAEEVMKEIDDIMDETTPSEGDVLENEAVEKAKEVLGSPLYEDKLSQMTITQLNELFMEMEVLIRELSETLISELTLKDELEYEKELKNSFISLLLAVQNRRRQYHVEKKKHKAQNKAPTGLEPKYLTTVIPYHLDNGPPDNQALQVLIKILKAINEDSPTVPTLLTDYILKVLCPT